MGRDAADRVLMRQCHLKSLKLPAAFLVLLERRDLPVADPWRNRDRAWPLRSRLFQGQTRGNLAAHSCCACQSRRASRVTPILVSG